MREYLYIYVRTNSLSLSLSLSRARARSLSHVKNVHFQVKHYEAIKVAVLVWLHVSLNHKPKP